MILMKNLIFSIVLTSSLFSAHLNIVTKYRNSGGILGPINKTTDKVNGREICPTNPTAGCDFSADVGYDDNGTRDDGSDDSYNGDLIVRTNDNFTVIAGWMWSDIDDNSEDKVTITGTLPQTNGKSYYEWASLPGFCSKDGSSIKDNGQTIVCVRENFDKNRAGTYAEDLAFQVRVKGSTPDGIQPGDIAFKISSKNSVDKNDTTDGYSLTVTASPRWNLYVGHYPYFYQGVDPDDNKTRGYFVTFKYRIGTDEVEGEEDDVNPALGNESMGKDRTFSFVDHLTKMPPNAKLLYCSTKGRTHLLDKYKDDGFIGYDEPITFYDTNSIRYGESYKDRHILASNNEQTISCKKDGDDLSVDIRGVDATLDNYPTKNFNGGALPLSRAIATIATAHFFVPFSDIEKGNDNQLGTSDDYKYAIEHYATGFDPNTPMPEHNSNFGSDIESEKDNISNFTLPYPGGWSHGWRGKEAPEYKEGYVFKNPGGTWVSGDGVVTAGEEISTYTALTGRDYDDYQACEIVDAYRTEIVPINENKRYLNIGKRYVSKLEAPITIGIVNDTSDFTDGLPYNDGSGSHDFDSLPYTVEYASGYVDDSFLPSKGGDTSISHESDIKRECTDSTIKWYSDFATARSQSPLGVTKVRFKLKPNKIVRTGTVSYFFVNTHIREKDLATGNYMKNKDLIVTYGSRKIGKSGSWVYSDYTPKTFDENHENQGWGDRVAYTGPKARIKKSENKSSASFKDMIDYTLKSTYTVGTSTPFSGDIKITDILPKDFKYIAGSTKSLDSTIDEPTIGDCSDANDLDSNCDDSINQVLVWNLGSRVANEKIEDINYSVKIGNFSNVGTSYNKVKIESPTDLSSLSKRKSLVGVNIAIPSSIDIYKSTVENPDYPSKRERTTEFKEINFLMDIQNLTDGSLTNLDVIDLLPFVGDGERVINFSSIKVKRDIPTSYHGTMRFKSVSFGQHPDSNSACNTRDIKFYYTNKDPKEINIAPSIGDANKIDTQTSRGGGNSRKLETQKSIWCQGDESGPNGCSVDGVVLTNDTVTAVRAVDVTMDTQAVCQFKVNIEVKDNLAGDNYSNSAGASANEVTLPVLSNSVAVPIVGSSLGDRVWFDKNGNGIQDEDESGISGVKVKLLNGDGNPIKNPMNPEEDYMVTTTVDGKYSFQKLNSGKYIIEVEVPSKYLVTKKGVSSDTEDSNLNSDTFKTDIITLDIDEDNPTVDIGLVTPTISGKVFDDGNGDGVVNGTPISAPEGNQLYVTLLDNTGKAIATKAIDSNGTYEFNGDDGVKANSSYSVVLSTTPNSTTASLPTNWNSADGEHIGLGAGLDGLSDGKIKVDIKKANVLNVNFGINERPTTQNVSSPSKLNPNREIQVIDLLPKDREDVIPNIVTIHTLPSGGVLYYDGKAVVADQNITDFNNSKLTVKPNSGNTVIVFTYSATDKAGWSSEGTSRVRMPFYVPAPVAYTEPTPTPTATPQEETPQQEVQQEPTQQEQQPQEEQPVIYNLDITDDEVEANTEGATTVINVLSNDAVGDGVTIKLVNITEGEILWNQGTAVGGTSVSTTDTLVVEGEGTWRVVDGTITFTAEDGFEGVPTPIYYLVKDQNGNQSNIAEVSIKTNCTCKAYTTKSHDSVSALNGFSMAFIMFITSILSLLLFRREENI